MVPVQVRLIPPVITEDEKVFCEVGDSQTPFRRVSAVKKIKHVSLRPGAA